MSVEMRPGLDGIARRILDELVRHAESNTLDRWMELILGVERTQVRSGDRWETVALRFMRTSGGPNIYVTVNASGIVRVEVYWGQSHVLVEDLGPDGKDLFDELRRLVEGE